MAVIQISKIQVRRGPQDDLPGRPIQVDPVEFSPGLDVGEFGFATDTGRLFIGHDPSEGSFNAARAVFPYRNIEVLTENSKEILAGMIDERLRENGTESFLTLTLPEAASFIAVPTISIPVFASASIDYHAFSNGRSVRTGLIRLAHVTDTVEPYISDSALYQSVISSGGSTPDDYLGRLQFKAVVNSPSTSDAHVGLTYKNITGFPVTFRYRILVALP